MPYHSLTAAALAEDKKLCLAYIHYRALKEYYDIVNEARPLSGLFPQMLIFFFFTEMQL